MNAPCGDDGEPGVGRREALRDGNETWRRKENGIALYIYLAGGVDDEEEEEEEEEEVLWSGPGRILWSIIIVIALVALAKVPSTK